MRRKTEEMEDKAVGRRSRKAPAMEPSEENAGEVDKETWAKPNRRGWKDEPPPLPSPVLRTGEGVTIRMKAGRQWALPSRVLRPGERVMLDATTAAEIVAAGYAIYTED